MARNLLFTGLVAGVLFIATGGHFHPGFVLVIGLTLLLGQLEPLTAR